MVGHSLLYKVFSHSMLLVPWWLELSGLVSGLGGWREGLKPDGMESWVGGVGRRGGKS